MEPCADISASNAVLDMFLRKKKMCTQVGNRLFHVPQVSDNFFSVRHAAHLYDNSLLHAADARGGPDLVPTGRGVNQAKGTKKNQGVPQRRGNR